MAHPKVIGIIPARYNSSRFPGKMLANILGKSLIQKTYENISSLIDFDELIIATDDERIKIHVEGFGAKAVMTSAACQSGSERAAEVIKNYFPEAEIVVIVQGDEPLLDPSIVKKLIDDLKNKSDAVMTTPVEVICDEEEIKRPSIVKCVFDKNGRALYFSRSPIPFCFKKKTSIYRHIGVYCFRKEFLLKYVTLSDASLRDAEDLEQLKILENGYPIHVTVVPTSGNIGVDYPEDIKKIEESCKKNTSSLQGASSLL